MTFPNEVAALVAHFTAELSVPVHVDVPKPRPDDWLQVRRVGGPANPPVRDQPNIDLKAWGLTALDAYNLLIEARTVAWQLRDGATVGGVKFYSVREMMGPAQTTDPESGAPVAWLTASFTTRADDAIMFTS